MKKTNNSYLVKKVALRIRHLPENPVVLDLFHGNGTIWRSVEKTLGQKIIVHGIDLREYEDLALLGDNQKHLSKIDLSKYNVIDIDAYGIPYQLMSEIFSKKISKNIIVFYTFIQSGMGSLPNGLLYENGYTKKMIDDSHIFASRHGHDKWLFYLSKYGIRKVYHVSHGRKFYGCFQINPSCPNSSEIS